ncbi:insulinase family protein [bacterium]|nr:insulinase family protein [bacterium]
MKRITTVLMVCAMLLMIGAAALHAQDVDKLNYPKLNPIQIPDVEKVTLPNGMRLYILEDHMLPVFNASVRINVGGYLEPADMIGLAEMTGEVLRTGGTEKWTGDEIDEMLEGVGGSVETSIDRLSGNARVNVLSEYTDLGLEVLAEILRNPTFDADKIDLAKVNQRSGISRRNDDPQQLAIREFLKVIYGPESVYARHAEYKTINAVTREDMVAFHDQWFHPENIQIAVWGDFKSDEIIEKIKQYFGDWEKGNVTVPEPPQVDYDYDQHVYYAEKADVNQSNVLVGHLGGLVTDPDYADRIVMNSIFGGSFGSRMFNNVRSKEGLAYATFGSYTANISYPGVFIGFASTKSETTGKAVKEIVKQVEGMQNNPPTEDEMRMGKDGYLNSFVFNFDNRAEVVNRMMNYDFYDFPEDFLAQEKEKVEKVTPEAVVAAAKRNLHPDKLRVLVVGNKADFEMPLDSLNMGPVTEIDITIPSGEEKNELAITPENLARGAELIEAAAVAHGGTANFAAVKTMNVKAQVTVSTPQGEFPFPIESTDVLPDKSCTIANMMGTKIYDIRDGSKGWKTIAPGQIGEKTEEDILDEKKAQLRDLVWVFSHLKSDPYFQAVYEGPGQLDNKAVEWVTLVDMQSETICRLAFDPATKMVVGRSYWGSGMMGGEGTITESFETYTEAGGIKLPGKVVRNMDGQKMAVMEIQEMTVNGDVSPDLFNEPTL